MPSTTSSSVSSDLASSTVMTPSLPTFFMASARNLPISASPLAEMVPTWAISSFEVTFLEFLTRSATTASTARSIPRFRSIGFMPAATDLAPSFTIAAASTVAVVVPSPAASADLEATSRTIWAPIFSNLSSSSICLATVTPSLVMRGAPNDLSSTTLRPFGPSVTFTALLRISTPRIMRSRASTPNLTSLADIMISLNLITIGARSSERHETRDLNYCLILRERRLRRLPRIKKTSWRLRGLLFRDGQIGENAHDVAFLHDQQFLTIELDLVARPLAEQHAVANLKIDRNELAGFVAATWADRRDFALRGLLLGSIRNDDATSGFVFGIDASDHDAVVQRTEFHAILLGFCDYFWIGTRNARVLAALDISLLHRGARASAHDV